MAELFPQALVVKSDIMDVDDEELMIDVQSISFIWQLDNQNDLNPFIYDSGIFEQIQNINPGSVLIYIEKCPTEGLNSHLKIQENLSDGKLFELSNLKKIDIEGKVLIEIVFSTDENPEYNRLIRIKTAIVNGKREGPFQSQLFVRKGKNEDLDFLLYEYHATFYDKDCDQIHYEVSLNPSEWKVCLFGGHGITFTFPPVILSEEDLEKFFPELDQLDLPNLKTFIDRSHFYYSISTEAN